MRRLTEIDADRECVSFQLRMIRVWNLEGQEIGDSFPRLPNGEFESIDVQNAWEGWQARAALAAEAQRDGGE